MLSHPFRPNPGERMGHGKGSPGAVGDLAHGYAFGQHLLDAAQRLAGALFVFDEGEADVAVAVVAEADAGD